MEVQRLGNDSAYAQIVLDAVCTGPQQGQQVLAYTGPTDGTAANISSAEHVVGWSLCSKVDRWAVRFCLRGSWVNRSEQGQTRLSGACACA